MEDIRDTAIEFGEWLKGVPLWLNNGNRWEPHDENGDELWMEQLFDIFLAEKIQNT